MTVTRYPIFWVVAMNLWTRTSMDVWTNCSIDYLHRPHRILRVYVRNYRRVKSNRSFSRMLRALSSALLASNATTHASRFL